MCLCNCQLSSFHVRIYAGHHPVVIPFCFSLNHSIKSFLHIRTGVHKTGFPGVSLVRNPSANAEDAGDLSLIPALGFSFTLSSTISLTRVLISDVSGVCSHTKQFSVTPARYPTGQFNSDTY